MTKSRPKAGGECRKGWQFSSFTTKQMMHRNGKNSENTSRNAYLAGTVTEKAAISASKIPGRYNNKQNKIPWIKNVWIYRRGKQWTWSGQYKVEYDLIIERVFRMDDKSPRTISAYRPRLTIGQIPPEPEDGFERLLDKIEEKVLPQYIRDRETESRSGRDVILKTNAYIVW